MIQLIIPRDGNSGTSPQTNCQVIFGSYKMSYINLHDLDIGPAYII